MYPQPMFLAVIFKALEAVRMTTQRLLVGSEPHM
jgi:hypothetical protein